MLQVFLVVAVLVGLAFVGLGFNIFFRKIAFPENEVGKNKNMKSLGLSCTKCNEMKRFREIRKYQTVTIDIKKLSL